LLSVDQLLSSFTNVVETRRAGRSILFLFLSVCCRPVSDSSKKKTAKKAKHKNIEKNSSHARPVYHYWVLLCTHTHTRYTLLYFLCLLYGPPKREERRVWGGGRQNRHAAFLLPGYIQFITVYYTFYKKWMALWYNKGNTHTHTHR
jgi:hypothetical protein